MEGDCAKFKNLIYNGKCIVYEVISRVNNLDIRRRYLHYYRILALLTDTKLQFNIQDTDNRYISGERTAANVRKVLHIHKIITGFKKSKETSVYDIRDALTMQVEYFLALLMILESMDKMHRYLMEVANSYLEADEYSLFISQTMLRYKEYLNMLDDNEKKVIVLSDIFEWSEESSIIAHCLSNTELLNFTVDVFKLYIGIFLDLFKKHDEKFLDMSLNSEIDEIINEYNHGEKPYKKVRFMKTTSRICEHTLGSAVCLLAKNMQTRCCIIKALLRLRTIKFNWMESFSVDERANHRREGRKILDYHPTRMEVSQCVMDKMLMKQYIDDENNIKKKKQEELRCIERKKREELLEQKKKVIEDEKEGLQGVISCLIGSRMEIPKVTVVELRKCIAKINQVLAPEDAIEVKSNVRRDELIQMIYRKLEDMMSLSLERLTLS